MYVSDNMFIKNSAVSNSAGIYMKQIGRIYIKNNRFENNIAQYGSCLYSTEQNSNYNKSIVTNNNQFINNKAMYAAQVYYQDIFIYNIKSNKFINNTG